MACSKGKDKQMQFILQWYQECNKMLLEERHTGCLTTQANRRILETAANLDSLPTFSLKFGDDAVQVAVFNYVSKVVGSEIPVATSTTGEGASIELSPEPDNV